MKRLIAIAALAAAAAGALDTQAAMVCGGVGSDARRELASAASGANLSLEFSLAGRGNYVADVEVTLTPAGQGTPVTLKTDGPICYLDLPPGRYTVELNVNGKRTQQRVFLHTETFEWSIEGAHPSSPSGYYATLLLT